MKKVLAIMGSPRKNKNTDMLLNKMLDGMEECEINKVYLRDMRISPCTSCYYCAKTGECCIDDDMQKLYKEFDSSDAVIVASPLYFNTVSSLTKIMIDRCQMFWSSKYELNNSSIDRYKMRKGAFLCVGGSPYRENQFNACTPVMELFFKAINTEYKYNLFCSGTDKIPVSEREDILNDAMNIGKNFF